MPYDFTHTWNLRNKIDEYMQVGEGQREGDTESKTGSRLPAINTEPDAGLEPTNCEIMT